MKLFVKYAGLAIMAMSLAACTQIDDGQVGVKTTFGGKISMQELDQGFHPIIPLVDKVQKFSGKEIKVNITDKPMLPLSAEGQQLAKFDAEVYYYVENSKIAELDLKYSGNHEKLNGNILAPSQDLVYSLSRSEARNVISTIASLDISKSRDAISSSVKDSVQSLLDKSDPNTFYITKFIIRDIKPNESIALSAAKNVNKQNEAEAIGKELGIAKTQKLINDQLSSSITPEILAMRRLDIDEKRVEMLRETCKGGSCTFFVDSGSSSIAPMLTVK